MLKNISWQEYIFSIALLLVIYYVFVLVRYFSAEVKGLLSGKSLVNFKAQSAKVDISLQEDHQINQLEVFEEKILNDEFADIEELIGRLKTVIEKAASQKMPVEVLKREIWQTLKEYSWLKDSPLCSSINELILSECEKYGIAALSENEAELLWYETAQ